MLKRNTPLKRYKPLARSTKRIKKVSDKRKVQVDAYNSGRIDFLIEHSECEIRFEGCTGVSTEVHHTEGRENERLTDFSKCLGTCRNCHDIATEDSKRAIEAGVSKRRNGSISKQIDDNDANNSHLLSANNHSLRANDHLRGNNDESYLH